MRAAVAALAKQCRIMSRIAQRVGAPRLRDFPPGFKGLAKIVVGQQLSAQSAAAIWGRLDAAIVPLDAETVLARNDDQLRAHGLSSGKIKTLRALARSVAEDGLDFEALNTAADNVIIERLTSIHGIGPWTADIYLLFVLCRRDAFAPGDLALQLCVQHHFKLQTRPTAAELEAIAERWRPSRAVAAQLLWADYAFARRKLAPPRRAAVIK